MTDVYLVRHGETNYNQAGRLQGHLPSYLTVKGQQQAQAVAGFFAHLPCARLISSDLRRCIETSQIISATVNLQPEFDTRLRELALGDAEGVHRDEALDKFPNLADLWDYPERPPAPNSETPACLQQRITDFISGGLTPEAHPIIVVSHAGPILTMAALAGDYSLSEAQNLPLANGSISKCTFINGQFEIVDFNLVGHLQSDHQQAGTCTHER